MKTVILDIQDGLVLPDSKLLQAAKDFFALDEDVITIGSELFLCAFRAVSKQLEVSFIVYDSADGKSHWVENGKFLSLPASVGCTDDFLDILINWE